MTAKNIEENNKLGLGVVVLYPSSFYSDRSYNDVEMCKKGLILADGRIQNLSPEGLTNTIYPRYNILFIELRIQSFLS